MELLIQEEIPMTKAFHGREERDRRGAEVRPVRTGVLTSLYRGFSAMTLRDYSFSLFLGDW